MFDFQPEQFTIKFNNINTINIEMQLRTSIINSYQCPATADYFYKKTHSDRFMHNLGPWENCTQIQTNKFSTVNLREKQYISEESKRFLINTRHFKNSDNFSSNKLRCENVGSYDFKNMGEGQERANKEDSRFLRLKTIAINENLGEELSHKAENFVGFMSGVVRASHAAKISYADRTGHKEIIDKTAKKNKGMIEKTGKRSHPVKICKTGHTRKGSQTDQLVATGRSQPKPTSQRDRLKIEKMCQGERPFRQSNRIKSEIKTELEGLPIFYLKPPKNTVLTREKNLMKIRNLKNKRLRIATD